MLQQTSAYLSGWELRRRWIRRGEIPFPMASRTLSRIQVEHRFRTCKWSLSYSETEGDDFLFQIFFVDQGYTRSLPIQMIRPINNRFVVSNTFACLQTFSISNSWWLVACWTSASRSSESTRPSTWANRMESQCNRWIQRNDQGCLAFVCKNHRWAKYDRADVIWSCDEEMVLILWTFCEALGQHWWHATDSLKKAFSRLGRLSNLDVIFIICSIFCCVSLCCLTFHSVHRGSLYRSVCVCAAWFSTKLVCFPLFFCVL